MAYRNGYSPEDRDLDRDDRNNDGMGKPHIIEHLATFTVNQETGITYPADGMRRLLQLEKQNGIWSQKMQISLDNDRVLIMDESGGIIEVFPANSILEPTAFTSHDYTEIYNNILVFIVTNSNNPSEMHIFQCQSISAQDLVEDLKQLRMGKTVTRSRKSSIPPAMSKPPQNIIHAQKEYHGSDSELTANNDDCSSTTSEKYEKDVAILNHCFDDIEKFIARLQHAAAAARELERRRKNRKTKKKDMGDGMLTMRTKPPPEKEFVDIFQKFKLSFNLLAKLKAHIHDPNAPELVHFLFTPLALIVEAANDNYFEQNIPLNVYSPLLTREAINLLQHCVTSKETELWHSLGPAWLVPRDQFKGSVPQYNPTFMDGWTPDYPIVDSFEPSMEHKMYRDAHEGYNSEYNDYPSSHDNMLYDNRSGDHHADKDLMPPAGESTRSDYSIDSMDRNGGEDRGYGRNHDAFLEELQSRQAHIVRVIYPRTANNDKELTVVRGEILEILDSSRKWWKARNSKGQVAHVPHTIVNTINSNIINNPVYVSQFRNQGRADSPDHINAGHGSGLQDHPPKTSADWIKNERQEPLYSGRSDGYDYNIRSPALSTASSMTSMNSITNPPRLNPIPRPHRLVQEAALSPPPAPPLPPPSPVSRPASQSSHAKNPPPPPPPPSQTSTPAYYSSKSQEEQGEVQPAKLQRSPSQYSIDLGSILSVLHERGKPSPKIKIKQTPEVFINEHSSAEEVTNWLKAKHFSEVICNRFKGVTGKDIFQFERSDLEEYCGMAEGKRLMSQLKIQKSNSGFQTMKSSELQLLLAKAREKAEKKRDQVDAQNNE